MSTPIVVHPSAPTGGRRVTINDEIAGLVHDDRDLIELLRRAGIYDAEQCLDDPLWIEWRGGRAHQYEAAEDRLTPSHRGLGRAECYERRLPPGA